MNASLIEGVDALTIVDDLDIESLPKGKVTRLLVEMTRDALARPVWVPVLVARGKKPGPVFGLTAALHGNELNGIFAIQALFQNLNPATLKGTVVAVAVANTPGFLLQQRSFEDNSDLNLLMPGAEHGNASRTYAYRLVDRIVRHFDYLIDLHTASFGRVNSLYVRADMTHPFAAQMAYLQRPQIIAHKPASAYTLRGVAMSLNIPSITVEIGNPQRYHKEFVKRSLRGIRAVLAAIGMVAAGRPITLKEQPVLCARSYWLYTDRGGMLTVEPAVTEILDAKTVFAKQTNIFGDLIKEYIMPEKGVVIGKNVNPVSQTGARLIHLGVLAGEEDRLLPREAWPISHTLERED